MTSDLNLKTRIVLFLAVLALLTVIAFTGTGILADGGPPVSLCT